MNYTLNQLRIFIKVVDNLSITKASEELHLTQPAVSIQLKNFQEQFEIPLLEVINKKIYITEFGHEIANAARRILLEVDTIDHRIKAFKGQLFGKLKISIVSTGKYIMPYYLADFIKNNPGVELELDVTNKSKVLKSLEKNETDFALVSIIPDKLALERIELLENKLYLVGSTKCGLTDKKYPIDLLKRIPLIFREEGSGTRRTMELFLEQHQISTKKNLELTSNEAVKQAVIADLGLSIMPYIGIKNEIELGLIKIISVKGLPIATNWNVVYHKAKKMTPVGLAFKEFLIKNKDNIKREYFSNG
jgi:DNA-binding transcriptional LysR family regulator